MSEEQGVQEEVKEGAPAWVMTFADLMSLLMCFFVLLLAFSEMDVEKFKQLSGSMKQAFGVQREVKADEIPKGTSIITQEFSPGIPQPTPFQVVQQQTTDDSKDNLDFASGEKTEEAKFAEKIYEAAVKRIRDEAEKLVEELKGEIDSGLLEVEWSESEITVRLRERGSFNSGEAKLKPTFFKIIERISQTLNKVKGNIIVAGHTDNVPISNYEFRSNWELSAARAANVVHYLTTKGKVNADRVQIRAHADTKPLVPNNSWDNKAKNRRVEIIIAGNEQLFIELNNNFSVGEVEKTVTNSSSTDNE